MSDKLSRRNILKMGMALAATGALDWKAGKLSADGDAPEYAIYQRDGEAPYLVLQPFFPYAPEIPATLWDMEGNVIERYERPFAPYYIESYFIEPPMMYERGADGRIRRLTDD